MTKLTYRGKNYSQNAKAPQKHLVQLTYRRNVYLSRQENTSNNKDQISLAYRGVKYNT